MATNDNNEIILDNNTNQIANSSWLLAVTGDFNFTEWGHYYRSRRHLFRYPTNNQQKRWWRKEGEQKIRAKRSQQSLASHNHAWIMISTTRRVAHYQHPPHFFFLFRFDFFLSLVCLFLFCFSENLIHFWHNTQRSPSHMQTTTSYVALIWPKKGSAYQSWMSTFSVE